MIRPSQQLLDTFQGPNRLITKRHDKHIDFSASLQRAEKNKDPTKTKSVSKFRIHNRVQNIICPFYLNTATRRSKQVQVHLRGIKQSISGGIANSFRLVEKRFRHGHLRVYFGSKAFRWENHKRTFGAYGRK